MEKEIKLNENNLSLKAIPDLYDKNFFIPDYQRGYRWGTRQVTQLMNDLCNFRYNGKGDFYCLQPIVVKELSDEEKNLYNLHSDTDDNRWYEVIDGQQRLTTIRIILALFAKVSLFFNHKFTIEYQTRPTLGGIFDKFIYEPTHSLYEISADTAQDLSIDHWHILQAAKCVLSWLKEGENKAVGLTYFGGTFLEFFTQQKGFADKKSVQVIWYELRDNSDPNETFKRLNDRKVSLNNAELIRAMFLSDSAVYECDEKLLNGYDKESRPIVVERERASRQSHIVEKWDIIEKQLRQPKFWAFIKNDGLDVGYSCRIEYLFDLIAKKDEKEKDELYTYLRFDDMLTKCDDIKDLWDLWVRVESCFDTLLSWYHNRYYYHKIGYLIAEKKSVGLNDLLEMSTKLSKTRFKQNIDWLIKKHIMIEPKDDIYTYSYDGGDRQKEALKSILFFFNVESTRLAQTQDNFPFELYKNEKWTLEHIHAQNSERIDSNNRDKWKEWIDAHIKAFGRLEKRFDKDHRYDPRPIIEILKDNKERVDSSKYTFDKDFISCFDSVTNYFNTMAKDNGGSPEIHDISNMALLSGSINTAISNSVFEVKRQLIMERDAEGGYIPYCTRLIFLKYYNNKSDDFSVQQSFYWSEQDRENYLANIKEILKPILETKDPNAEDNITIENEVNVAN